MKAIIALLCLFTLPNLAPRQLDAQTLEPVSSVALPQTLFSGTDIERVDLLSGALQIRIPLLNLPGRGMNTNLTFSYTSKVWHTSPVNDIYGPGNGGTAYWSAANDRIPLSGGSAPPITWGSAAMGWSLGIPRMAYFDSSNVYTYDIWGLWTQRWKTLDGSTIGLVDSKGTYNDSGSTRGCYALASLISLAVMRIANAMKWIPLSVLGSRS
jgi:hypothetical protein